MDVAYIHVDHKKNTAQAMFFLGDENSDFHKNARKAEAFIDELILLFLFFDFLKANNLIAVINRTDECNDFHIGQIRYNIDKYSSYNILDEVTKSQVVDLVKKRFIVTNKLRQLVENEFKSEQEIELERIEIRHKRELDQAKEIHEDQMESADKKYEGERRFLIGGLIASWFVVVISISVPLWVAYKTTADVRIVNSMDKAMENNEVINIPLDHGNTFDSLLSGQNNILARSFELQYDILKYNSDLIEEFVIDGYMYNYSLGRGAIFHIEDNTGLDVN